jgi:hypothetical protein
VGAERAAFGQGLGVSPQVGAEGVDHGSVGGGEAAVGRPAQDHGASAAGLLGQPALAGARLAAEQEQGAGAFAGALECLADPAQLCLPSDQRDPRNHGSV